MGPRHTGTPGQFSDSMSSSMSPDPTASRSGQSQSPPSGGPGAEQSKGLSFNSIFKSLAERRNARADGSQPKRRGPKPDSKPALTRRQELNRQAQRTHRERKELYVKALEEQVMRLREDYATMSQDKERLAVENRQLRELLTQHNILFPGIQGPTGGGNGQGDGSHFGGGGDNSSWGGSRGAMSQGSFSPGATSQTTPPSVSSCGPPQYQRPSGQDLRYMTQQASASKSIDYDQAGIDFVLTLERPCMDHIPLMLDRAKDSEYENGHALMASCPSKPLDELPPDLPWGTSHVHDDSGSGQKTWEITKADLCTLIDLSAKIDLGGEITPIMAWGLVMSHPRLLDLDVADLQVLANALRAKIRCYGFGAVTEEFEVRDAIDDVLSSHPRQVMV